MLSHGLASEGEIEIVGTAPDPFFARDKIVKLAPDVVILDLQMPRMDGLSFLKKLMSFHPLPVIVFSSIAEEGTRTALEALDLGALFVVPKPSCDQNTTELMAQLRETVKEAALAKLRPAPVTEALGAEERVYRAVDRQCAQKVIVMGASTGGTEALKTVLSALPAGGPAVLAVIHMPVGFTRKFAERLSTFCKMPVREAVDGEVVVPAQVLIARGDRHLGLHRSGQALIAQVQEGPLICRHRPSVEVLFQSAARAAGPDALGIIMTGMGADGARGLLAMRDAGAYTIAQDENSSIVYGMPREAALLHAAIDILPLNRIADACVRWFNSKVHALPRMGG